MGKKSKAEEEAFKMYMSGNLTIDQIARASGVAVRTVGKWIAKGNWKEEREKARLTNHELEQNVLAAMNFIAAKLKQEENPILRVKMGDEYSKLNASLRDIRHDGKLQLSQYTMVLEEVLNFCNARHPNITSELADALAAFAKQKSKELL